MLRVMALSLIASLAILPASSAKEKKEDEFVARAMPHFSTAGPRGFTPITISAMINGPTTEKNYCLGFVIVWPDTTETTRFFDCPPYDEYMKQWDRFNRCADQVTGAALLDCPIPYDLERSFSRTRNFAPGTYNLEVKFVRTRSDKKDDYIVVGHATAFFRVSGGE